MSQERVTPARSRGLMAALYATPTDPTGPRSSSSWARIRPIPTGPPTLSALEQQRWKRRVAQAFGQAAEHYHEEAEVQREVALKLSDRIAPLALGAQPRVLEVGCGTGLLAQALGARVAERVWVATDLSGGMLASFRGRLPRETNAIAPRDNARAHCVCMDGEAPAVRGPFDLICSSMAMQWFVALEQSLARLHGLLRPGGYLACATLVEGTFEQWRRAHERVGLPAPMLHYPSVEHLRALWPEPELVQLETEMITRRYGSAREFLTGLKRLGANTPGLGGPAPTAGQLKRVLRSLDETSGFEISYQLAYAIFQRHRRPTQSIGCRGR
jgi:malonyl-ACP O-methyltransferase BioC